jgi:hypothetical protein
MRDSNVANAAKESAQHKFPHGLLDLCTGEPRPTPQTEVRCEDGRQLCLLPLANEHSLRLETQRSEPAPRMGIIQKHNNIVLRKRESKAILSAMGNSMPENFASAPTSLWPGAMRAHLQPERVFLD